MGDGKELDQPLELIHPLPSPMFVGNPGMSPENPGIAWDLHNINTNARKSENKATNQKQTYSYKRHGILWGQVALT